MLTRFDERHVARLLQRHGPQYHEAKPFPHAVMDDFLPSDQLRLIAGAIPDTVSVGDEVYQKTKRSQSNIYALPAALQDLVIALNAPVFLRFLEKLTGISGLIPDPYLLGGGFHQTRKGGYLRIHRDFLRHHKFHLDRRVNLLLYITDGWREEYGGQLELWDSTMTRCEARIVPIFNRCVVFNTGETTFHGHPEPLTCPDEVTRNSIALYYYTTPETNSRDGYLYATPWLHVRNGATKDKARHKHGYAAKELDSLKPLKKPEYALEAVEDGFVLVDTSGNSTTKLNESGALIWSMCDGRLTISEIKREIAKILDIREKRISDDVVQAVTMLREQNVITLANLCKGSNADRSEA